MSKKYRLLNRNSYFDKKSNRDILNRYGDYFYENDLNDIEIFELCIMLFHERYNYDYIKWKDMVRQMCVLDTRKVKKWFDEDLSAGERSRLSASVNKLISAELKSKTLDDLSAREFKCFEVLCLVTGGELDE